MNLPLTLPILKVFIFTFRNVYSIFTMMHSPPLKKIPSILAVFIIYYESILNVTSNNMHASPVKISVANIASVVNIGALDGVSCRLSN